MLRRNALLLAFSAIPSTCLPVVSLNTATTESVEELPFSAQDLAQIEFAAIKDAWPSSWQTISYVADAKLNSDWSAIYVATSDPRLLGLWAARVERAMYPGRLRVYDLGKAGQYAGMDDGYNVVTLFIVDRQSWELERSAFADLLAKYPQSQFA